MSPYIKAKFKGVFKKTKTHHVGNFVRSDFDWEYLEITDCEEIGDFDPEAHLTFDYRFYKKIASRRFWKFRKKREVFIPIGVDQFFSGTIYNVLIKNIKLTNDESSLLGADWREAVGDIYFQVEQREKIKDSLLKGDNTVAGVNIIRSENKIEVDNEWNIVTRGNNYYGNDAEVIMHHDGNSDNSFRTSNSTTDQSLPISQLMGRWSKWIARILLGFLFLLLLIYLWNSNRLLFYILVGLGVLWLLTRVINLGSTIRFLGSLLLFGIVGYFIFNLFYLSSSGSTPVKTREGNIKISPPKDTDSNGDGKIDDAITEKDINWFDFSNQHYIAKYNTSIASFQNSNNQQSELVLKTTGYNSSLDFFTKIYSGLFIIDETKIKKIAKIFSDSADLKKMNPTQTAEMVVTFIQEIPYYLVHEGTCQSAIESGNSFMVEYHQQHKPCLSNIPGGVQSPYEFLHNLKGDCDTRSLLGFSILKELNIASSVWVSETYGHSILGVGVPVGYGIYKNINGVNHYGVELTAKGYRLGMVSPENNNPNNWDITVYYNH